MVQGLRMYRNPLSFAPELQRRYGHVFTVPLPVLGKSVFVASPELVKAVFTTPPTNLNAGELLESMAGEVLGSHAVLTLDGPPHLRQRKLLLPPFHGERIRRYGELIREFTLEQMKSWPVGTPFPLLGHFQRITMAAILKSILGVHDPERLLHADRLWLRLQKASSSFLMIAPKPLQRDLGPLSPGGRFSRARRAVDDFIYELIDSRRADERLEEREDVLSLLMMARHDDGTPMSNEELRDELVALIVAGYETSAFALSWTIERLLRTPPAHARFKEAVAGGDSEYVDATIKESLRTRPVLVSVMRKLTAPMALGGFEIDAGTCVLPAITAMHYREDLFPQAQEFRPDRFLEGDAYKYAWIPFGGGTRRCVGSAFAEYEMRVVLETVFEHADLTAAEQAPERGKLEGMLLAPAKGAEVVLDGPLR